jgi:hypothetical protein
MQRSNSRMVILWVYPMGLSNIMQRSNSRMVILYCSMYLSNIMQRSNSRMVILWVYPMGLSHGFIQYHAEK